jgi:hypothetical protein
MANVNTQACDVCNALRHDNRHWLRVFIPNEAQITISSWDVDVAMDEQVKQVHICDQGCLVRFISSNFPGRPKTDRLKVINEATKKYLTKMRLG